MNPSSCSMMYCKASLKPREVVTKNTFSCGRATGWQCLCDNKWAPCSDKSEALTLHNENQAKLEALHSKPWLLCTSHIDFVSYFNNISVTGCEILSCLFFFNFSNSYAIINHFSAVNFVTKYGKCFCPIDSVHSRINQTFLCPFFFHLWKENTCLWSTV